MSAVDEVISPEPTDLRDSKIERRFPFCDKYTCVDYFEDHFVIQYADGFEISEADITVSLLLL